MKTRKRKGGTGPIQGEENDEINTYYTTETGKLPPKLAFNRTYKLTIPNLNNNNNNNTKSIPTKTIELYFIRHGQSCANLAKLHGKQFIQKTYLDPELTAYGHKTAKKYGPIFLKNQDITVSNTIFASSPLLRAQQTLEDLIGHINPNNLYIFPHVGEKASFTYDNQTMSIEKQQTFLHYKYRSDLRNTAIDSNPSDFKLFIEWFFTIFFNSTSYTNLTTLKRTLDTTNLGKVVIVSHSHFIQSILDHFRNNHTIQTKINNLDGIKLTYSTNSFGRHEFNSIEYIPTTIIKQNNNLSKSSCLESGCRKIKRICSNPAKGIRNWVTARRARRKIRN